VPATIGFCRLRVWLRHPVKTGTSSAKNFNQSLRIHSTQEMRV
jgi:hypothetical protein